MVFFGSDWNDGFDDDSPIGISSSMKEDIGDDYYCTENNTRSNSKNMSKRVCLACGSFDGKCCQSGFAFPNEIDCSDIHCDYFVEKKKPTVFETITSSPEVLAPKLVYQGFDGGFYSSVIEDGTKEFRNEPEAIAATVAKLKEVENG